MSHCKFRASFRASWVLSRPPVEWFNEMRTQEQLHSLLPWQASLPLVILAFLSWSICGHAQATATTLAAETVNNTSAARDFVSTNGNVSGGNVSKVPLRNLLYGGATTKIYAHFVGWFGGADHIDVGYNSADPLQVQKQVADMVSRGIDGVVIDWYGPTSRRRSATARNTEAATQALMAEAEKLTGFEFAIMVDKGALRECNGKCNPTDELIRDLTYVHDTYQKSPAYVRVDGRPIVLFFGVDRNFNIDWKKVARHLPENPILVEQDRRGFDSNDSKGSYAWVKVDREKPRDWMGTYLNWFYDQGKKSSGRGRDGKSDGSIALTHSSSVIGAVWKGFDDSMASWSEKRVMSQDCGRTWLNTWAALSENHSVDDPLPAVQMVTWNDYEEGTELESGIDNCVALHAWRAGDFVKWQVHWSDEKRADIKRNGPQQVDVNKFGMTAHAVAKPLPLALEQLTDSPETGIDHFAVYVSDDRRNLTKVAEVPSGERSFNVDTLQLPAGRHYVYVQAVGKPGLLNHMSGAFTFDVPQPR